MVAGPTHGIKERFAFPPLTRRKGGLLVSFQPKVPLFSGIITPSDSVVKSFGGPTQPKAGTAIAERIVTAKHPNHVWHVDLTVVPTAMGFCSRGFPIVAAEVAVLLLAGSRRRPLLARAMGVTAVKEQPTSANVRSFSARNRKGGHRAKAYHLRSRRAIRLRRISVMVLAKRNQAALRRGWQAWQHCRRQAPHSRFRARTRLAALDSLPPRGVSARATARYRVVQRTPAAYMAWWQDAGRSLQRHVPRQRRPRLEPRAKWPRGSPRRLWALVREVRRSDSTSRSRFSTAENTCHSESRSARHEAARPGNSQRPRRLSRLRRVKALCLIKLSMNDSPFRRICGGMADRSPHFPSKSRYSAVFSRPPLRL